ncbi:hypothetical protein D3C84_595920 [compost metagenome]
MCSRVSAGVRWFCTTGSAGTRRNKAQRPASSMPPMNAPRPRRLLRGWRLLAGVISARNPAKLSAFTNPAPTSSCRAISSSERSKWASWISSSKNSAPCWTRAAWTFCVFGESSLTGVCSVKPLQRPTRLRGSKTIGVLRRAVLALLLCAVRRVHTSLPLRHNSSSQVAE